MVFSGCLRFFLAFFSLFFFYFFFFPGSFLFFDEGLFPV